VARNDVQDLGTGFKKMYAGLSLSKTRANYFQCVPSHVLLGLSNGAAASSAFRRRKYCATVERRKNAGNYRTSVD